MRLYDLNTVSTNLSENEHSASHENRGVSLACFNGFDRDGRFLITLEGETKRIHAVSTISLTDSDLGTGVAVAFIGNDTRKPIILGRIQRTNAAPIDLIAKMDGERVVLHAEHEIELRCGEASITLTRAGKVIIKGNYVLTRSKGANKIKGAFVDIN